MIERNQCGSHIEKRICAIRHCDYFIFFSQVLIRTKHQHLQTAGDTGVI